MKTLYIAAIDIGNRDDNTSRAIEKIKSVNTIFVESYREGSKFLKHIGVKKNMVEFSEHTTYKDLDDIFDILLREDVVLISDCGTPLLEDPGRMLVSRCYEYGINVVALPGVSSITASLMVCPFPIKEFFYAGLLPRNDNERIKKLKSIKSINTVSIILDTPYRLEKVLAACVKVFSSREALIALDITTENEKIVVDNLQNLHRQFTNIKKREFVLIINKE